MSLDPGPGPAGARTAPLLLQGPDLGRGPGRAEGPGRRAQPQVHQAAAQGAGDEVLAARPGLGHDLALGRSQAHAPVVARSLLQDRRRVGEEDAGGAGLQQHVEQAAAGGVGEALGGQHHRGVGLAQGPQPLQQALPEHLVPQHRPGLVHQQEGRGPVQAALDAVEDVEQQGQALLLGQLQQLPDLEAVEGRSVPAQEVLAPVVDRQAGEGPQGRLELQALHLDDEVAQRGVAAAGVGPQGPPDLLPLGAGGSAARQADQALHPVHAPLHLPIAVDPGEGRQRRASLPHPVVAPSHRLVEGVEREALVEGVDPGPGVAEHLGRQEGQQGGLAASGGAEDQGVPHVGDVQVEPEGGGAAGDQDGQGRRSGRKLPGGAGGGAGVDRRGGAQVGQVE